MTRFAKEMRRKFSRAAWDSDTGDSGAYCIESDALVVFYDPYCVCVLRVLRNGKQKEVTDDYPRISAPYLVHLCGGDEDKARQILKSNHF